MATIQKIAPLLGKIFQDRIGNKYCLMNYTIQPGTEHIRTLIFQNSSNKVSRRRHDGRVYGDRASPLDIALVGLRTPSQPFVGAFGGHGDYDDMSGLDFIDLEDERLERTSRKPPRPKFGSIILGDELDDSLEIPRSPSTRNRKSNDVEITIKVKRY